MAFINTQRKVMIDSLVDGFKARMDNPYYAYMNTKPTPTTYYNQDDKRSSLDTGARQFYSPTGDGSPLKFNQINGMLIYGIERIITQLDSGEFGTEAASIEGEGIILPNTIIPIPNDYFEIDYINKKLLFKVISVTMDTIENGSNFYKISYKLDQLDNMDILENINEEFEMVVNNIGTQFNSIIRKNDYKFIDTVDNILSTLKKYYKSLFYSDRVQTFIFIYNGIYLYDPYLIEFLSKNKILSNSDEYIYVSHQLTIHNTFSLDYDKTFFRYVELSDKEGLSPRMFSQAVYIDEPMSLLSSRQEDYYKVEYINAEKQDIYKYIIQNFDIDLMQRIVDNHYYHIVDSKRYLDIIIKYFNNEEISSEDITKLEDIDYEPNINLFYYIPIIIYILENRVKKLLKR